ncbi:DUF397 domain-containing protein [Streptomyces sp. PmtG]
MTPNPPAPGPTLQWFKSSHSSNDGPECVEVALEWHKSSYSGNDEPDCVEVAISNPTATVHVRDSKNKTSPHLTVESATWAEFVSFATAH